MRRSYRLRQVFKHVALYPVRYLVPLRRRLPLWRAILRRQNSVPMYLVLRRGDVAVQVGTPNAYTLSRFSRLVGQTGRVVVMEADPDNAARLSASLAGSHRENVTVVNKGAWSSHGSMTLRRSAEFDGDHRFDVAGVSVDNDLRTDLSDVVEVPVAPLDDVLEELGIDAINYLSVTVNGAELEVLRGARRTLDRSTDVRVFSKGHARVEVDGGVVTLNESIRSFLIGLAYEAVVSRGEMSPTGPDAWGRRGGDVFAWRFGP